MDYPVDTPGSKADGEQQKKGKEPRVGRACDPCRRAKVRCLDGLPDRPCARCKTSKLACTFDEKAVKRGPPKGYVESLERRLEAMEALLRALSATSSADLDKLPTADFDFDDNGDDLQAFREHSTPGSTTGASPMGNGKTNVSLESVDRLAADLEELSVDKDRYVGRGSGLHLARSIREFSKTDIMPAIDSEHDSTPSIVELLLQEDHLRTSFHFELPPVDLQRKLLDAYWSRFNNSTPLLHRPSFERALADGSLERDTSFRSLFFMVCAVAARFVEDERLDIQYAVSDPVASRQSKGFEYFRASSGSASPALMSATLYDIQSSVLAIAWLLGAATPISAWACVGFAIRRVVDVGAHRENRKRWNSSPLADQLRRRAFGALFGIDRTISASLGRPLAIHDQDCDLGPPLDITDEALDEWNLRGPDSPPPPPSEIPGPLAGTNCLIRLQTIMGRALRLLYGMNRQSNTVEKATAAVTELDSLLNEYTSYYATQILVHRDNISPTRKMHTFPSLAICSNAARSCSHILDALRVASLEQEGFWFIPLAGVTSGLILLINVFANGPTGSSLTSSAMSDVKKCIHILEVLAPTTFLAGKCASGLDRLSTMAGHPVHPRNPDAPSLKRTNDWEDSDSPRSSGSLSNHPSPAANDSGVAEDHTNYKRKREGPRSSGSRGILPLTTDDLSLLTFNGRPTFAPPTINASPAPWASGMTTSGGMAAFDPQLPPNVPMFPQSPMDFNAPAWNPAVGTSLPPASGFSFAEFGGETTVEGFPGTGGGAAFGDPGNMFGGTFGGGMDSGGFEWRELVLIEACFSMTDGLILAFSKSMEPVFSQDFETILPLMTGTTDR
ncbi:hypothetical protein P7C70_g1875, partial [Phenoliferia sp. Uapishka_3]